MTVMYCQDCEEPGTTYLCEDCQQERIERHKLRHPSNQQVRSAYDEGGDD